MQAIARRGRVPEDEPKLQGLHWEGGRLHGAVVIKMSSLLILNSDMQELPKEAQEGYLRRANLLMQSQVAAGHPSVGRAARQVESSAFFLSDFFNRFLIRWKERRLTLSCSRTWESWSTMPAGFILITKIGWSQLLRRLGSAVRRPHVGHPAGHPSGDQTAGQVKSPLSLLRLECFYSGCFRYWLNSFCWWS